MQNLASYDARISSLEQGIARLEEELRTLKISRNARVPLVSLPDELILRIARFVTPDPIVMESSENLYKLTWICHRLRFLCVGARELWTVINITHWSPRSIRDFLDRSAPLSLSIQASTNRPRDHKAVEHSALLTGGLARTQSLYIRGIQRDCVLPNFSVLRVLHLAYNSHTLDTLSTFLRKTPQLEQMKLQYALSRSSIDALSHSTKEMRRPLQLPHLSELTIIDEEYCVAALLNILPDPASCFEVHLHSKENSSWLSTPNSNTLSRLEAFRRKRHGSGEALLSNARVKFTMGSSYCIIVQSQKESISYSNACFKLAITEEEALDSVKTLHIDGSMKTMDHTIQKLSTRLGPQCLPKLEQLVITSVVGDTNQADGEPSRALQDWMSLRRQAGCPIQSVAFVRCNDTARPLINELVRSLSVRSVTWDGEEQM
jgi:hypothetical protein